MLKRLSFLFFGLLFTFLFFAPTQAAEPPEYLSLQTAQTTIVDAPDQSFDQILALLDQIYDPTNTGLAGAKPPIVFVHGWQGMAGEALCQRQNDTYVDANWDRLDENMSGENPLMRERRPGDDPDNAGSGFDRIWYGHGFNVTIARLYSGGAGLPGASAGNEANCTPVAETNVPNLMEAIDLAKTNSGQPRVILIAHSMGGLVSRAYLEGSSYRDDVVALFTLGTPHMGVPAPALQTFVETLTLGIITLADYCISQPVVCQFSDDENDANFPPGFTGIETFNAAHNVRADGVYYHMLGSDADFSQRGWVGATMDAILSGPDDGIVPQPSGKGVSSWDGRLSPLTGPIDRLEVFPTLHVETFTDDPTCVVGTGDYVQRHHSFHNQDQWSVVDNCAFSFNVVKYRAIPSKSFLDCLSPTIQNRTTGHTCGTVTNLLTVPTGNYANLDAEPVRIPVQKNQLTTGSTATHDIWTSGGKTVFTVNGDLSIKDGSAGTLAVTLVTPDGIRINQQYLIDHPESFPDLNFKLISNATLFWFENAPAGHWQLEVTATTAAKNNAPVNYIVSGQHHTGVTLSGNVDKPYYHPGETATINATLTGSADATVIAHLSYPDGYRTSITLNPTENGHYTASFIAPSGRYGYAQLTLEATGSNQNKQPFSQNKIHLFQISSNNINLTGSYSDQIEPSLSNLTGYNDLVVRVGVSLNEKTTVGVMADLVDLKGNVVAHTTAFDTLPEGTNELALRFRGQKLTASGSDGVYTVENVRLIDYTHGGITISETSRAHKTASYQLTELNALVSTTAQQITAANRQSQQANVFANHTCTIDNLGPYNPGETITLNFNINKITTSYNEWFDLYFANGPDGWNIQSQSAAPADNSSWNRSTTATGCNPTGVAYWGISNPFLAPAANECALSLNNLPTSGSFAGPWASTEWYTVWSEGFEGSFPPAGWAAGGGSWNEDTTGNGNGFVKDGGTGHTSASSAIHPNNESCGGWPYPPCDWPISWIRSAPLQVEAGDRFSYWHKGNSFNGQDGNGWSGNEHAEIFLNTTINVQNGAQNYSGFKDHDSDISDDDYNVSNWSPGDPGTGWSKVIFNTTVQGEPYGIRDYAGRDDLYVAWRFYGDGPYWIDDVAIERARVAASSHTFAVTYVVDNDPATMCPGSNFVGVSSLIDDDRSGLAGVAMGDLVDYSLSSMGCNVAQTCPLPVVSFDLTVSNDGSCPGLPTVSVPQDAQDITFCYSMTNSSPDVTVTTHTYTNDLAPNSGTTLSIAPLATVLYSETINLGLAEGNYTNNSNWLAATNIGLGQLQGSGANSYYTDTSYTNSAADSVAIEITPPSCAAPNAPVNLVPTLSGTNVDLAWDIVIGADHYEVWWNSTPYAGATGPDCAAALNCSVEPAATFTHPSGAGASATNYFYTIFAGMGCGATSTNPANEVGEFDFSIIPGA